MTQLFADGLPVRMTLDPFGLPDALRSIIKTAKWSPFWSGGVSMKAGGRVGYGVITIS